MKQEIENERLSDGQLGMSCYLFGALSAVMFLLVKSCRDKPFVRFHAFQSLFLFITLGLLRWFGFSRRRGLGDLIYLAYLALIITWIVLMVTARKGKMVTVPL